MEKLHADSSTQMAYVERKTYLGEDGKTKPRWGAKEARRWKFSYSTRDKTGDGRILQRSHQVPKKIKRSNCKISGESRLSLQRIEKTEWQGEGM